jgi:hypothetical protein
LTVRHDDERAQEESSLAAIVENGSLKQFRRRSDLEKAAALRCHSGDQIRPSVLWSKPHLGSINETPVAEAIFVACLRSGACEGPRSRRHYSASALSSASVANASPGSSSAPAASSRFRGRDLPVRTPRPLSNSTWRIRLPRPSLSFFMALL